MKTIIVATENCQSITFTVSTNFVASVERIALSVRQVLGEGERMKRRNPDLEPLLERGEEWLKILGAPGDATLMVSPSYLMGAHAIVCLAIVGSDLTQEERNDFFQTLGFLGNTLTCFVLPQPLPALRKFQSDDEVPRRVRDLYRLLRNDPKPEIRFWVLKLDDAMELLDALSHQMDSRITKLCAELRRVTNNHFLALTHLIRADNRHSSKATSR